MSDISTEAHSIDNKPSFLVLGGCGFIGRHMVAFLVENNLAGYIRVVDKVPPQIAWFNKYFEKIFANPIVDFQSANLINVASCANAFSNDGSHGTWDYVINCAGETKLNQETPVYREGIFKLSVNVATEAARYRVKHFVELSSGQMASLEKVPHNEADVCEPWTQIAKYKLDVENELTKIPGLNYTILRPAVVYGKGDRVGLTPRIVIGAIYKYIDEPMKLLWSGGLKLNTIHVLDLCRAIWFVCERDATIARTYNVVDEANSTQGSITSIVADIFEVDYQFVDMLTSIIAQSNLSSLVEDINDKHSNPWAELCKRNEIFNTPLTPYVSKEYLQNKHLHLDRSGLSRLGFNVVISRPEKYLIEEIINDYMEMRLFPQSLSQQSG